MIASLTAISEVAAADVPTELVIQDGLLHLRGSGEREWSSFAEQPQASSLDRVFFARENQSEWTLSLQQVDVKQSWQVRINDRVIGTLVRDENLLVSDYAVPAKTIRRGQNRLQIVQTAAGGDDIRIGKVRLLGGSVKQFRSDASVIIDLIDQDRQPIPGRITIVDSNGALVPVDVEENKQLAVREGVIYTAAGSARFGVAAGKYRIFASRGFEYNAPSVTFVIDSGQTFKRTLQLTREVDTAGWVACDTHIHTVTHSGHGDCTIEERMATLVGEGIELPIATDHNQHIDYRPIAQALSVETYFTPVIGNEVTTGQGHFNIFPVASDAVPTPDHTTTNWADLFSDIYETPDVKVAILNHGRDIHAGFRPFSPRHHISLSGENLDQRDLPANAMELINSGAVQTDAMELFRDWCGLINRGRKITPVGSSDSHDVSRYIVGQGRTYIRCPDQDPANIDVAAALEALVRGSVIVSYGLMANVSVDQHGPGDMVRCGQRPVQVNVQLRGPSWARCSQVELFVNGYKMFAKQVDRKQAAAGVLGEVSWTIPEQQLPHDAWLTVVARGPGIRQPFWPTAQPYQPDSPSFQPYTFSCTGPLMLDVDDDGKFSSPQDYAHEILQTAAGQLDKVLEATAAHDRAVAIQVASMLTASGTDWSLPETQELLASSPTQLRDAIQAYRQAWRESQQSRAQSRE